MPYKYENTSILACLVVFCVDKLDVRLLDEEN